MVKHRSPKPKLKVRFFQGWAKYGLISKLYIQVGNLAYKIKQLFSMTQNQIEATSDGLTTSTLYPGKYSGNVAMSKLGIKTINL